MIINDLDDYYIVFDTKNRNTELDTLFNRTTACEGTLYVQKSYNNKPVSFSGGLLGRWSRLTPLKLTTLEINNVTFNDILFFDEKDTEQITSIDQVNPIKSFAWSKKYGLVQYSFKDGTVFSRVSKE